MVQSGTSASSLQPFLIKTGGSVTKLPKVDHSHAAASGNTGTDIREKDVAVLKLYANQVFVSIISRYHLQTSTRQGIFLLVLEKQYIAQRLPIFIY